MSPEQAVTICSEALEALKESVFSSEMKLTLVVRHPDDDECHMVVTADDLSEVLYVLHCAIAKGRL